MFRLIEYYSGSSTSIGHHPEGYRESLPAVARDERAVAAGALPPVPCHNDCCARTHR